MKINAIIMASGLSKRMNQNKLLMKINDKKIFEYILETIYKCSCFQEAIVVAKDVEILESAIKLGFKAVNNENSHLGQSVSIKLGIENSNDCNGYMFFVADQPFIEKETIQKLCRIFNDNYNKIIVPCLNDKNGNPVIFPKYLKDELMNIQGDAGGKVVINKNLDKVVKVQIEEQNQFIDIDTMKDYEICKKQVID